MDFANRLATKSTSIAHYRLYFCIYLIGWSAIDPYKWAYQHTGMRVLDATAADQIARRQQFMLDHKLNAVKVYIFCFYLRFCVFSVLFVLVALLL